MKLYIPDIGDILKLKENWTLNLSYSYRNEELLNFLGYDENFSIFDLEEKFVKITFPVDTELIVSKIDIKKGFSYNGIIFEIEKLGKKLKFHARLKDVNRIEIESNPTLGVLKLPIRWSSVYDIPEKGTKIFGVAKIKGKSFSAQVNGINSFKVIISELETKDQDGYIIVEKIKYKLICLLSDEIVGEWSTLTTIRKKAKEYVERNRKYFLDEEQKVSLRVEKFQRILKKEDNEDQIF